MTHSKKQNGQREKGILERSEDPEIQPSDKEEEAGWEGKRVTNQPHEGTQISIKGIIEL